VIFDSTTKTYDSYVQPMQKSSSVYGSTAFSIAAPPQACNQPPADIHNSATYWTFKHHRKSFLSTVLWTLDFIVQFPRALDPAE